MPLYHAVIMSLTKQPAAQCAKSLRKVCHEIYGKGGWVRAVENHGIRPLPYRIRSPYSPEDERYHWDARVVSLYFDAPPAAKNSMELALRLDEQVLRFTTMRTKSIVDEVLSVKPSNPWNDAAGVEVKKMKQKTKRFKYGRGEEEGSARQEELAEFVEKYLSTKAS